MGQRLVPRAVAFVLRYVRSVLSWRVVGVAAGALLALVAGRLFADAVGLPGVITSGLTAGTLILGMACTCWTVGRERRSLEGAQAAQAAPPPEPDREPVAA